MTLAFAYHDLAFEIVRMAIGLGMVPAAQSEALMAEVSRVAAESTAYMFRRAEQRGTTDSVLAATTRDPRQYE